jgi:DNA processing protein
MPYDELAAWLRLTLTPGVGNSTARKLLAAFGLPQAVFGQSSTALLQVVTPAQAQALQSAPPELAGLLDLTWRWLDEEVPATAPDGVQRRIVALGDPGYPAALLDIEDPPLMLYLLGQVTAAPGAGHAQAGPSEASTDGLAMALRRSLAMVGSRNPTPQGASNARQFARAFSEAGLTIVSGLALGIDGAAHLGALEGAEASESPHGRLATIAVVGTGLDRVYPKKHLALAHRIARHGLLISEYPLGTPPIPANFPKRNRIISGLSLGTLVVEAALKSGSLITARLASEQGKDVFAIPGSIHASQSHGCHALIKQGAKLVESAQDVLEELRLPPDPAPSNSEFIANNADPTPGNCQKSFENPLLDALGFDPVGLDALLARTGMDAATLQIRLLELELEGAVARLPGGLFQRLGAA